MKDKLSLPKEWKVKNFSEVCELVGGSQPSKNEFIYEPKEGYIRLIQVRDYRTDKFVTYIPKKKAKRFCNEEDIMIGRYGPPIFGIFKGLKGAYNVALMKATVNEKICDRNYFFLFLKTDELRHFVESSSKRAAGQDGIRKELLNNYPVPLPPIPEQQRIVALLKETFAAIDKAKANAEQNLKNAKELFESYLQRVFENKGEGWEEKTLKELTTHLGDGLHGTPKYTLDGDYYFINGNNLNDGIIKFKSSTKRVSFDEYNKHKKNLNDRTILVSINGTLGNVAFYNNEKIILGKSACYFNMKQGVDKNYIKYVLSSSYFLKYAHKEATGATIKNVSLKTMREFIVPLPSQKEQQTIVQKLDSLSTETKKLESIYQQKINDLEELKKSVLQKAFSGELKVSELGLVD